MPPSTYLPIFELTRGETVESIHYGAVAVVNAHGQLVASFGNPQATTYLRSSAKPFQAIPFIEHNGKAQFNLSQREIALMCASHAGTDEHVAVLNKIQDKANLSESDLMCGVHPPYDTATAKALQERGEQPTPNRHNCSGKHTGMLAYAHMRDWPANEYINQEHPVQKNILTAFSEMSGVPREEVEIGIDGCSAPNFAIPLRNAALAFARLCDPSGFSQTRKTACKTIVAAMTDHPFIVAGPERFDTRLMEVTGGRVVTKGGAEGYQAIGLLPNVLSTNSPALGIAFKVSDGDLRSRARPAITIEILRQLQVLSQSELEELAAFGPSIPIHNWQKKEVGKTRPSFKLNLEENFRP
jgi:L-asparaginase II